MNVLHVNMSLNRVTGGGTVERIFQIHKSLSELGIESHVLTVNDPADDRKKSPIENITYLPCLSTRWFIPIPTISPIRKLVEQADVIHLMNHWTVLNVLVYLQAKKQGKPYIVCPAGSLTVFGRSKIKKYLYQFLIGRNIFRNASAAIAISSDEVGQLEEGGVAPQRVHHIPNGVNERDFDYADGALFREISGIGTTPYILFLGRLNPIKGPDLLLEAFSKICAGVPHILVFAGPDGGMEEQLTKQVLELNLQGRVYFTGHLGGDLKSSAYHGAEVLVVPSRHEAMSIVALEAAVSSTPVLLTDQCGFSSLADAGAALEVPATINGLVEGLEQMLVEPCDLKEMGTRGRKFALECYSWSIMSKRLIKLCKSIELPTI